EPGGEGSERTDPAKLPPRVRVLPHYAAIQSGVKTGDRVVSIDGQPIRQFQDFSAAIAEAAGREIGMKVERGGQMVDIKITPATMTVPDGF
ncbi:PDZ domain-containing protein, partial [Staphylococcus aureus]